MSKLKYKEKLEALKKSGCKCPPAGAAPKNQLVYRWVCNPMTDNCFLPQAIKNPKRVLRAKSLEEECSCWGLSMHINKESSKRAFKAVKASLPQASKIFGGFIGEGAVDSSSGLLTEPNDYGHLDLHPFESFAGVSSFKVVDKA